MRVLWCRGQAHVKGGLLVDFKDLELRHAVHSICAGVHPNAQHHELSNATFCIHISGEVISEACPWHHDPLTHGLGTTFLASELVRERIVKERITALVFDPSGGRTCRF